MGDGGETKVSVCVHLTEVHLSAEISSCMFCRSYVSSGASGVKIDLSVKWSELRSRTFCRFFICFQTYSHLLNPEMQSPETQSSVDAEM